MTRAEQETIINFNAAENTAELYTSDPVWIRKMDKMVESNPEQFKVGKGETYQGDIVAKRYSFPKQLLTIRKKKRELTDEQRKEAAERLRNVRGKGDVDG